MPPEELGTEQAPNNVYTVMLVVALLLVLFSVGLSFYELSAEYGFMGAAESELGGD